MARALLARTSSSTLVALRQASTPALRAHGAAWQHGLQTHLHAQQHAHEQIIQERARGCYKYEGTVPKR